MLSSFMLTDERPLANPGSRYTSRDPRPSILKSLKTIGDVDLAVLPARRWRFPGDLVHLGLGAARYAISSHF